MAKTKLPSPCIDVCKFRRPGGHCIGCSMTKGQKKLWKSARKPGSREAFVTLLVHQQDALGRYDHWTRVYLKKLAKKDRTAPTVLEKRRAG